MENHCNFKILEKSFISTLKVIVHQQKYFNTINHICFLKYFENIFCLSYFILVANFKPHKTFSIFKGIFILSNSVPFPLRVQYPLR